MKNQARLDYKGERFLIWQDGNSNWYFTYQNLESVNTGHKELQPALNGIYESVDERLNPHVGRRSKNSKPKSLMDKLSI